jgi:hypothetical protein
VPLATALCKTFLLRMLNDSWADRNPTWGVVPIEDEQKNCPRYVEFLDKNKFGKFVRLLVLL